MESWLCRTLPVERCLSNVGSTIECLRRYDETHLVYACKRHSDKSILFCLLSFDIQRCEQQGRSKVSVGFSYPIPLLLGLCVISAIACVFMLQRYAKSLDQGSLEERCSGSSESDRNPYQPPSELELQEQFHGLEIGQVKDRQLKVRVALPSICVLAAIAVGVGACLCRPIANVGSVHYEMIVALFILVSLALLLVYLNHPARHAFPTFVFSIRKFFFMVSVCLGLDFG